MTGFQLERIGVVMEPEPGNSTEAGGVLNPAAARGPDGQLYLFPRLVAVGNHSRIGIARVRFNAAGDPEGVDRIGIALEPTEDFEAGTAGTGGCEDPRITFVEPLRRYVMTYTALSPYGPRIALAISENLFDWQKLGLATFRPYQGIAFEGIDNKDASVFPTAIPDPSGQMSMAILHRPLFPGTRPEDMAKHGWQRYVDLEHESIWISYCSTALERCAPRHLCHFGSHHRLATPIAAWERLKIGGGTPPLLTRHGWLTFYHGVSSRSDVSRQPDVPRQLCYSAGVLVLSKDAPHVIRYRSAEPVLTPELRVERQGVVANVVFPTAIDRRDDLGTPDRIDVYYGMADARIGVAKLLVPEVLPGDARADARRATV
jgi:beta-1,2-mannobiose phosphorylase / 1,2-beta-oligomannan phosphorylase